MIPTPSSSPRRTPSAAPSMIASVAGLLLLTTGVAPAETFNLGVGGTWNLAGNWNPASIPNSVGASAIFNGVATGSNPVQTANRTIPVDAAQTVGSLLFNNDLSTFTNSLTVGTAGTLTFDATGAGPATITVPAAAAGTGNNTISAPMILTDSVRAIVNNITASSGAGALNLTAAISGPGGFTKEGDGMMTFGTGAKTYTGATVLSGGRTRISITAQPSATSSFTINAGGQLEIITAGTAAFGPGNLNLNGTGALSGPFAAFPGAIRNTTNTAVSISNATVLQSDTLIHVQGSTSGITTFTNIISGSGKLTFTAPVSDANVGTLRLDGANIYSGGTQVNGGQLLLASASSSLGSGNVSVEGEFSPLSGSRLTIQSGVLNGIADTATLTLDGGGTAGTADIGFVDLGAGINETVGGLVLGGLTQAPGTYGSTASGATFQFNEYFAGTGVLTVVPEPGSAALLAGGFALLLGLQRRRKA